MGNTKIEWATTVWNPVTGCTPVSVTVHEDKLSEPLRWRKPRQIFVCSSSMGDLFHKDVPADLYPKLWRTMTKCPQHRFLIPTKRAKRMREVLREMGGYDPEGRIPLSTKYRDFAENVWLGVSVENQATADERIPDLMATPAAVRFVSDEPALGPVDFTKVKHPQQIAGVDQVMTFNSLSRKGGIAFKDGIGLDWVIVGGESGPGARPMHPEWVRVLRDQCQAAGVPFFFKQWGEWAELPPFNYSPAIGSGNREYCRALRAYERQHGASRLVDDRKEGWPDYMIRDGCAITDGEIAIGRVGKKKAGRILDGRTWDEMPERNDHV